MAASRASPPKVTNGLVVAAAAAAAAEAGADLDLNPAPGRRASPAPRLSASYLARAVHAVPGAASRLSRASARQPPPGATATAFRPSTSSAPHLQTAATTVNGEAAADHAYQRNYHTMAARSTTIVMWYVSLGQVTLVSPCVGQHRHGRPGLDRLRQSSIGSTMKVFVPWSP